MPVVAAGLGRFVFVSAAFVCLVGVAAMGPSVAVAADLDPAADYSAERVNPITYRVELAAVVTPPYKTKQLRVWIPIPPTNAGQEVSTSKFSTFPTDVRPRLASEPMYGNRFAYFEFDQPQGAQIIRHEFDVTVWELRWGIEPSQVQLVKDWPKAFEPYRRSESQAVVVDRRFEELLARIVPRRSNPLTEMTSVMTWVQDNFEYDHVDASLQADASHALLKQRGHCSDYHGFCASLGRALGYPTRVTYGINTFPKNSPSHCKLEAYLPPYGWVSFDVSETQRLLADIRKSVQLSDEEKQQLSAAALKRMTTGFRDNTWFVQTRGTDYDLAPPASRRVAVIRTLYAETDGKPLPEPDPANKEQREFSWMTAHRYTPDREVIYPFSDLSTLKEWTSE